MRPFPPLRKTLLQLLGPSVLFFSLALSGGELLLWPNMAANAGLVVLWAVPIILFLQFVVNIEIERTAIVTGKGTEQQLVGTSRLLAPFFVGSIIISLMWPAWMNTAGNIISFIVLPAGTSEAAQRNVGLLITIVLLTIAILIFHHPRSYNLLEKMAKGALIIVLSIIILIVATNFRSDLFWEGLRGLTAFGAIPHGISRFDFLAALAYGGVAGVLNFVQSEWVIKKGYGVAALPAIERNNINWDSPNSRQNFRAWFRAMNTEHFFIFFCANFFSLFLLSYLGRLLIPLGTAQGFTVLATEIRVLNNTIPFLGTLFALGAIVIFIMANITILDAIGRLIHPLLPRLFPHRTHRATSQHISILAIIIGIVILTSALFIPNFKQPFALLVISASLSAMVMWIYPPILLKLNYSLPALTRPSFWRAAILLLTTCFYGAVSLWALAGIFPLPLVITIGILVTAYQCSFFIRKKKYDAVV